MAAGSPRNTAPPPCSPRAQARQTEPDAEAYRCVWSQDHQLILDTPPLSILDTPLPPGRRSTNWSQQ